MAVLVFQNNLSNIIFSAWLLIVWSSISERFGGIRGGSGGGGAWNHVAMWPGFGMYVLADERRFLTAVEHTS